MLRKEFLREKAVDSGICFDKASQQKKRVTCKGIVGRYRGERV